jgi:sRNA-binding regulator protein Hfq
MLHQLHLKFDQWLNAMGKKVLVINHELVNKLRTTLKSQKVDEFEARLEQEEQIMIERYRFLDQKLVELEVNLEKREKIFIEIALANGLKVQPLAAMKEGGGGNLRERRTGIVNPKEFRVRIAEQHNQKAV